MMEPPDYFYEPLVARVRSIQKQKHRQQKKRPRVCLPFDDLPLRPRLAIVPQLLHAPMEGSRASSQRRFDLLAPLVCEHPLTISPNGLNPPCSNGLLTIPRR